jgi:O-antigen/teichoic acid export membrane protein
MLFANGPAMCHEIRAIRTAMRREDATLRQTTGTHAFRGGLWQAATQISPFAFTLVISIIAARILGPDDMGRQSYIAFIVVVAQAFLGGGLSTAILRFSGDLVGRGRVSSLRSLVRCTLPISVVASCIGGIALLVLAALGASPAWAWIYAAVATAAGVLSVVPGSLLLGAQKWRSVAHATLVTGAVSVVATLVVLELGGGISGMIAVIAAAAVARYLWIEVLARRLLATLDQPREPFAEMRSQVLTFSLAMSVPVILSLVVNQRSEFFFLEHYSSDNQIAFYSIAFSATAALIAVPRAIGAVLTPSVAALVGSGESDRIRSGFSRVLRLSLLFGLPITAASLALGPELLRLLYGDRYAGAGDVLLIVLLTVPLAPLAGASSALLVGYGRVRSPIVVSAVAAAVDIALAIVFVQRFDAIGAAVANTCASFVATGLLLGATVRLVGHIDLCGHFMLRVAAISAVSGVLARLVLVMGGGAGVFLLATAVEIVALGVGATTLRPVSADDASFLVGVAGGRARVARILARLSDRKVRVPV